MHGRYLAGEREPVDQDLIEQIQSAKEGSAHAMAHVRFGVVGSVIAHVAGG